MQEADIIDHQVAHVADASLRPEHHLTENNKPALYPVCHINIITALDAS